MILTEKQSEHYEINIPSKGINKYMNNNMNGHNFPEKDYNNNHDGKFLKKRKGRHLIKEQNGIIR